MLVIPKSRFKSHVDHHLWNNLSEEKPLTKSVAFFKSLIKTHFYKLFFAFFKVIFSVFTGYILIAFACVHVNLSVKKIA